jgi:hypothetical protein
MKRDISYLKPIKFKEYFTLTEASREIGCSIEWLRRLEKDGRIPLAVRVKRGKLEIRLWSPAQIEEIQEILATHRPGRPSGG